MIDGDRVYTIGAEGKLHCLKLETGQLYWKRDVAGEFKVPQDFFGVASTPLIEGDSLIVNVGAPGGPCVAAFDKRTGKMMWGTGDLWGASYASPVPAVVHGKRRLLVFAGGESQPPTGGLLGIDPVTGAIDFQFPWRSRSYESVNASCPVAIGNQVFVSASYKTGGALLDLLPGGGHKVAWTTPEFGLHFNTPIHRDGYLYGFDGRNEPDAALACVELATGKPCGAFLRSGKKRFGAMGLNKNKHWELFVVRCCGPTEAFFVWENWAICSVWSSLRRGIGKSRGHGCLPHARAGRCRC